MLTQAEEESRSAPESYHKNKKAGVRIFYKMTSSGNEIGVEGRHYASLGTLQYFSFRGTVVVVACDLASLHLFFMGVFHQEGNN